MGLGFCFLLCFFHRLTDDLKGAKYLFKWKKEKSDFSSGSIGLCSFSIDILLSLVSLTAVAIRYYKMMKCSVASKLYLIKYKIYFRVHGHYRRWHEIKAFSFV